MELVEKAKVVNNFGIRTKFPWTGSDRAPWTQVVTDSKEISFVKDLLSPQYLFRDPVIVRRVENPYLWARYVLAYEELDAHIPGPVEERRVIHATSMSNALNIAAENFDWRRVRRARFGNGVSFAVDATYAYKYAARGKDAYIVAGIPIAQKTYGSYNTKIPGSMCDTTVDTNGNVYVKYYDNDFYPYYIVQ